jgi:hypothetical protein
MNTVRGYLTPGQKNYLFEKQWNGRCNNRPDSMDIAFGVIHNGALVKYECPMWKLYDGFFDFAGYEADHIVELSAGGTNDLNNFQLICPSCHKVKTNNYLQQPIVGGKRHFTSEERMRGGAHMEELERTPNKKKAQMKIKKEGMDLSFGKRRTKVTKKKGKKLN